MADATEFRLPKTRWEAEQMIAAIGGIYPDLARQPQVPAEDVERVIAQIKDAERAMIEERKGQYGSAFKCEQQVAIEGMHRQQIVGARLMAAALTALQVTEGDKR